MALSVKFPVETGRPIRSYHFCGRADDLEAIASVFESSSDNGGGTSSSDSACCVIHGIAGVGKSLTALEYSYVYGSRYQVICWLRAETSALLTKSFSMIAAKLKLMPAPTPQSSQGGSEGGQIWSAVDLAKEWLERTGTLRLLHSEPRFRPSSGLLTALHR